MHQYSTYPVAVFPRSIETHHAIGIAPLLHRDKRGVLEGCLKLEQQVAHEVGSFILHILFACFRSLSVFYLSALGPANLCMTQVTIPKISKSPRPVTSTAD